MALQIVPVRPRPADFSTFQSTTLDDVRYQLSFSYNKFGDFWSMDIADAAGTALVDGIKLALGIDLIKAYKYITGFPQGELFCYDTTRTDVEPGKDDFDERVILFYRPFADL